MTQPQNWVRKLFRGSKVWVLADREGRPVITEGRATVRYRKDDPDTSYRVNPRNLLDFSAAQAPREKPKHEEPLVPETAPGVIIAYTDGAAKGNPGPAGLGVVLCYGTHRREISEYLGETTNNVAELTAIKKALEAIKDRNKPVVVHTDSTYAMGVLTLNWKAKANQKLVADIRELIGRFAKLTFRKVKGHAGIEENERADELANQAVERGLSF